MWIAKTCCPVFWCIACNLVHRGLGQPVALLAGSTWTVRLFMHSSLNVLQHGSVAQYKKRSSTCHLATWRQRLTSVTITPRQIAIAPLRGWGTGSNCRSGTETVQHFTSYINVPKSTIKEAYHCEENQLLNQWPRIHLYNYFCFNLLSPQIICI